MLLRWLIAAPLLALATVGFSRVAQDRMEVLREEANEEEMLYLPNQNLLDYFTAGMNSIVADLLWLRTVEYTVTEFHNEARKFTWLEHMLSTITRLDPGFEGAYVHGGALLAAIGADDAALRLLKPGAINLPRSKEIPIQLFQVYVLNRRERPETPVMAAHYLRMAAERTDDAAQRKYFLDVIQGLQRQKGLAHEARRIWEDTLRTSQDPVMREIAGEKLVDLAIRDNIEALGDVVKRYETAQGRKPTSFQDLIDVGLLDKSPAIPDHGEYFIDSRGAVRNTVLLEAETVQTRGFINARVKSYQREKGRFPVSLDELSAWADKPIPKNPYEDRVWTYDPATGKVE